MKLNHSALLVIGLFITISCGQTGENSKVPAEDRVKFEQYLVQGKALYETYCIACHQENGEGLAKLYPPLAKSDYLLADIPRAACIIKYGQVDEITVNGSTYNQMMPGLEHLTNLEIAEILTYVTNTWGNEEGLADVKEVDKWLKNCEN